MASGPFTPREDAVDELIHAVGAAGEAQIPVVVPAGEPFLDAERFMGWFASQRPVLMQANN